MRISDWSSDVCSSDLIMPEETEGHAFEQGRPLTRPRTRHRFGEGRVHGFGIVAVDADARNAVTVGACRDILTPGHLFELGMLGEKVVLADEDRRQDRKSTRLNSSH